jgi:DNA topoisomerase-1
MSDGSDEEYAFGETPTPVKKKKKVRPDAAPSSSNGNSNVARKDKKDSSSSKKKRKLPPGEKSSSSSSKKVKVKNESSSASASANDGAAASAAKKPRVLKKLDKAERLQYAMQSFLWWNAKEPPPGCQWGTMEHCAVSFPEPYVPHGIKLKYDGQDVVLTPAQEEAATFFAAMDPDGMHLGNPKTGKIFIKNFFNDFKVTLGRGHVVKDFTKCDFEPIRRHLNEQKMVKKAITDQERKANKEDRNEVLFKFGYAIVDGHIERVGNFNMEPPGAFRGRGEHPKMGKLKHRVVPEQVSLNMSECAPVPVCTVAGHAWSDVRHDPRGQWLATWKENINNQSKYMQLAAQSSFKGKSDRSKYTKAALLCKNIAKIRKSYGKDLKSKDNETKQLATAVWVIDRLALRVGGEKDTDEEADTVGCCSLRVEHLRFDPNEEGGENKEILLEFLGKDSMLYKQTIDFGAALYNDNNGMGTQVYINFKAFCKKKKQSEEVFESINPTTMNNHLKQFMDGLSAKVFRTYNASKTLQDELRKHEGSPAWRNLTASQKVSDNLNVLLQINAGTFLTFFRFCSFTVGCRVQQRKQGGRYSL